MPWGAIAGGIASALLGGDEKQSSQPFKLQKNIAESGISIKVADAKRAGIHPIYALGANIAYPPAVQTGERRNRLSHMGQNINRAISAIKTAQERRLSEVLLKQEEEKLAQMGLETISMRNDLNNINEIPALPDATNKGIVQGQTPGTVVIPKRITASNIPGQEPGIIPGGQVAMMPNRRMAETITEPMSEPIESDAYNAQLRYGEKIIQHFDSWIYSAAATRDYTPGGRRFKRQLERRRMRLGKPPRGYHYSFDFAMNSFYLTPNEYKKSKKFRTPSGGKGLRQKIYNQPK